MKGIIEKVNKMPLIAAFMIYQALIVGRIFIEMGVKGITVVLMQLFWFDCVLMFFVFCYKCILRLKNSDLSVLFFGGFLTYIPMIYSVLMHHKWNLNFINPASFREVVFDVLTLLAVHEYNWPMFPELVLLLASSFALGWILTRKGFRAAATALVATTGSFLMLGFAWFSVTPKHPALFVLRSGLKDHQNYALYYISFFIIFSCIAFKEQLSDFIKVFKRKWLFALLLLLGVLVDFAAFWCFGVDFTAYDLVVNFLPALALVLMPSLIKSKSYKLSFLFGWSVMGALTILFFPPRF